MKRIGPLIAVGAALMITAAIVLVLATGNGDEAVAGSSVPPTTVQATQSEPTQPEVTVTAFDRSQLPPRP